MPKEKFDRFFNHEKLQFNKTSNGVVLKEYADYNLIIKEALKKYNQEDENIEVLKGEKKSFIKYWQTHVIDSISNHGTKNKNENVKSKLEKYLKSIHKTDLLFKDITTPFLRSLRHYMLNKPDPKRLSNNSANHNLKIISGGITQAEKDEYYTYFKNPFKAIKYNNEKIKRSILSQEEVHRLLNTEIPTHDKKH